MKDIFPTKADSFSSNPFLSLLPKRGELSRLESLSNSLYARLEKVQSELDESGRTPEQHKKVEAEVTMLKQVLTWINPRNQQILG